MTKRKAEKLKPGDKVAPKYDAFEISFLARRTKVKTVEKVEWDKYSNMYLIHTTDGEARAHKQMDLVETI